LQSAGSQTPTTAAPCYFAARISNPVFPVMIRLARRVIQSPPASLANRDLSKPCLRIAKAKSGRPDLILMDIVGADGAGLPVSTHRQRYRQELPESAVMQRAGEAPTRSKK
jgi:hypothetical protein